VISKLRQSPLRIAGGVDRPIKPNLTTRSTAFRDRGLIYLANSGRGRSRYASASHLNEVLLDRLIDLGWIGKFSHLLLDDGKPTKTKGISR